MLDLFKSKKNKGTSNVIDIINEAKNQTLERDEKRHQQADVLYNEALELIEKYKETNNDSLLEQACKKLEESLTFNRSKGESYFWLSYIFYIYGNDKEAFECLRTAESLVPDYQQIKQFKNIISETQRSN